MNLSELRAEIERLNRCLRPIAKRTVDINSADWQQKLAAAPPPLDEAGVRPDGEAALQAAIDLYARGDADAREAIRDMFRVNDSFAWAATLPFEPDDPQHVFAHLLHFSIIDQGNDPRDAVLWLSDLCSKAAVPGRELADLRERAAALSSDVDRYEWFGSTRQLLEKGYGPYGR